MSPIVLSEILVVDLQVCQEENPARCALSDQHGQYVLDDDQQIIALNLFGYDGEDGHPTLPNPAEWLPELPRLKYLNLARCGLIALDLTAQIELVVLFAQENESLTELKLPAAFPALLRADLSHCALTNIIWPSSPVLEFLNVSRQDGKSLTDWSFTTACPQLYFCDLSHNGLTNLGILCLEDNALTEVAFDGRLPRLESLRLSGNKLTTVKSEWLDRAPNLLNLFLEKNEIEDRYLTFIEDKSPHEAVLSLRDVFRNEALGTAKNDECKVMLIGNGKAGKSCIVYRMKHGKFKKEWDSTHGVELFPYKTKNWKLAFWDFGGQDVYHSTHRLFMQSNVVYLLVWSKETDPKMSPTLEIEEDGELRKYRNYSLPYWLHYAKVLGKDSPVILVQTHKAEGVDSLAYLEKINDSSPKTILRIESKWDDMEENGYNNLLREIDRAVKKLKQQEGEMAAKNILKIRQWLRERQEADIKILPLSEYLDRAEQLKIRGAKDVLSSWLHKTGVLFYDQQKMGGRIILNQQWAIEAIYTLFDRKKPHYKRLRSRGGVFTGWDLNAIWRDWQDADPELFVEFMLSCEVCFELPTGEKDFEHRSFLAPGLLPETKLPDLVDLWQNKPHWEVHFRYTILHYGVVQSLLVQTRSLAQLQKMTQSSTLLTFGSQMATVEAERDEEYLNRIVVKIGREDLQLLGQIQSVLQEVQNEVPTVLIREPGGHRLVTYKRIDAAFTYPNATVESENGDFIPATPFYDFWGYRAKGRLVPSDGTNPMILDDQVGKELANYAQGSTRVQVPKEVVTRSSNAIGEKEKVKLEEELILFASSNPSGTAELQLSEEYIQISRHLEDQPQYGFRSRTQLTGGEFVDAVCEIRPSILHFSGHGDSGKEELRSMATRLGVDFKDDTGLIFYAENKRDPQLISTTNLKTLFGLFQKEGVPLKYIIFNSCHSHLQAKAISELGYTVIGTSIAINDSAAIAFVNGFYRALSAGDDLRGCVLRGLMKAVIHSLDKTEINIYQHGKKIKI
jgi:hypothetical protein